MLSFWCHTKLSHLLPLDVMLTKSVNIKLHGNRHGRIPCFCSISLCSNYQFDLFVHVDLYSPLNYPRIMFQEAPDTRRKTIADVLWNNCWPDGPKWRRWVEGCLLLEDPTSHAWELRPEPLTLGARGWPVRLLGSPSVCWPSQQDGHGASLYQTLQIPRYVQNNIKVKTTHTHTHTLYFNSSKVLISLLCLLWLKIHFLTLCSNARDFRITGMRWEIML